MNARIILCSKYDVLRWGFVIGIGVLLWRRTMTMIKMSWNQLGNDNGLGNEQHISFPSKDNEISSFVVLFLFKV
mgnify:CR=1 FL=1|jgi:hypothetical protein